MVETIQRCFLFFGGDSWPSDRYVQDALRTRLIRAGDRFICQDEMPETAPSQSFDSRVARARRFAESLDARELILIGRSSGGRVASLIAGSLPQRTHVVALGYPFKHPQQPPEPIRYVHLASLDVPMFIIQGSRDEYGSGDPRARVDLSPFIETRVVPGPHALSLDEDGWSEVAGWIKHSIARWAPSPVDLAEAG